MSGKRQAEGSQLSGPDRKRARMREQRTIGVQGHPPAQGGSSASGNAALPPTIDVDKFANTRLFEINSLQTAMRNAKAAGTVRAFQSLPRSLRRRAASHNIRRLPVRLRAKAKTETPPDAAQPKKRSRKMVGRKLTARSKLSRVARLLKRQIKKAWLETHIWHAKRMHMKNIWGHRLAEKPTEKSHRSSYRAALHGALVHDASYFQYLQLTGSEANLSVMLEALCDKDGPNCPTSKRFTTGSRECHTCLYHPKYVASVVPSTPAPYRSLIGPVTIIWKPLPEAEPNPQQTELRDTPNLPRPPPARTLLVRLHPSLCEAALQAVEIAQGFAISRGMEPLPDGFGLSSRVRVDRLYKKLLTFEVMGRRATEVVKAVLKPTPGNSKVAHEAWKSLSTSAGPGSVPAGMIVGLQVYDPRLSFPPKLSHSEPPAGTSAVRPSAPTATMTQFWESINEPTKKPKFRKSELDARRSNLLVPGTKLQALQQDDRIPLLLSQRTLSQSPNSSTPDDFHGWTLTIPAGWGMAFWSSLVHCTPRIAGLTARSQTYFESGTPRFPEDYPGTIGFDIYEAEREAEDKGFWERRPPAKRTNFDKVGTGDPFRANFSRIVKRWVGREVNLVWVMDSAEVMKFVKRRREKVTGSEKTETASEEEKGRYDGALVRVRLTPCGRGAPEELGLIYQLEDSQRKEVGERVQREKRGQTGKGSLLDRDGPFRVPLPTPKDVIGRITTGSFSLKQGRGSAMGAIPLSCFLSLTSGGSPNSSPSRRPLVAFRNRDSEIFRPATLELLL
ncbi:POP1-domain-containing protein [Meredithblackwellia eburnea MCA 4105]